MWLTIITMTTVGYGDLFPRTHLGRLVAIISCFIGMALVSLLVATLNRIIEFTREEEKAFTIIKKRNAIT